MLLKLNHCDQTKTPPDNLSSKSKSNKFRPITNLNVEISPQQTKESNSSREKLVRSAHSSPRTQKCEIQFLIDDRDKHEKISDSPDKNTPAFPGNNSVRKRNGIKASNGKSANSNERLLHSKNLVKD